MVEALWKAGCFRLRGLLVGTVAFQTYAGLLGSKLTGAALMTSDVDVAQFHSISLLVNDTTPPMGDVLAAVDPSFKPVPHLDDRTLPTAYQNDRGYKVEFLPPTAAPMTIRASRRECLHWEELAPSRSATWIS